ncbi:Transcription elognation factor Eaf, N-terminal [Lasallia pustulata]|uniref:Transcription elognation factor Eaf, N-terminal n=1 Tax=Lasallia pustulata TaxID=136370 RepID=A0A1W5D578_9LECA|nr:Transcription elognation factor Eaf, N-terminal [Lasallia pustulata]
MAAAVSNAMLIDPSKGAKYPVSISEDLLRRDQPSTKKYLASLEYNHRPELPKAPKRTAITPSIRPDDSYHLTATGEDGQKACEYTGIQRPSESYALIYHPAGERFTLDRISSDFKFNLTYTLHDKSGKGLAQQYPQLDTKLPAPESDEDGLFDEDNGSTTGDLDNPYDYRHFLERPDKRRRTSSPETTTVRSLAPSPLPRRPSRSKPKPRPRPQQRRQSPPPREEADADNEDSEDGELTIEIDPADKPKGLGRAFARPIGDGPISLRSAANSVSPVGREIIEPEDNDSDVDEMPEKSPSPDAAPAPGDDEDADDLEAELEQAMESQADEEMGGTEEVQRAVQESSSESEEE